MGHRRRRCRRPSRGQERHLGTRDNRLGFGAPRRQGGDVPSQAGLESAASGYSMPWLRLGRRRQAQASGSANRGGGLPIRTASFQ